MRVFVSYALRDRYITKELLGSFRECAKNQGIDCYVDLLDNDYNEEGFQKKLINILKNCDAFLIVDSLEYANSKWTKKEMEIAKDLQIKILKIDSSKLEKICLNNLDICTLF